MKIETAIQQREFQHLPEKTLVNLVFTGSWLTSKIDDLLKPYAISSHQYNVLRILRGQNGASLCLQDVKARMLERNPDVSRIVDRLAKVGFVERTLDPGNRRKIEIKIKEKGLELLQQIDDQYQAFFKSFDLLSEPELEQLNEMLDRLHGGDE